MFLNFIFKLFQEASQVNISSNPTVRGPLHCVYRSAIQSGSDHWTCQTLLWNVFQLIPGAYLCNPQIQNYGLILILLNKLSLPHLFLTVNQSDNSMLFCSHKFTNWMKSSVDPDQMASEEAIWSRSILFSKTLPILIQRG